MIKIIGLILFGLSLSACGTTSTSTTAVSQKGGDGVVEGDGGQAAANESGLGTVAYEERTRKQDCKRVRIAGSHRYKSTCDDRSSGSYNVTDGNWASVGQYATEGGSTNTGPTVPH